MQLFHNSGNHLKRPKHPDSAFKKTEPTVRSSSITHSSIMCSHDGGHLKSLSCFLRKVPRERKPPSTVKTSAVSELLNPVGLVWPLDQRLAKSHKEEKKDKIMKESHRSDMFLTGIVSACSQLSYWVQRSRKRLQRFDHSHAE